MTIWQLISDSTFPQKHILNKLVCHFMEMTREQLYLESEKEVSDSIYDKIKTAYYAYTVDKKPMEYVLWFVEFFWNKFYVNENTLIPRPETEYMINAVTEYVSTLPTDNENYLFDIGTGSGVLWTSVLLQNPEFFNKSVMTDISEWALEVAKDNYKTLIWDKIESKFLKANLIDFVPNYSNDFLKGKLILVSNLPYIPDQTFDDNAEENVKNWEPRMAFVWGDDGLDYYREMFNQSFDYVLQGVLTKDITMFLEMMTWQVDILRKEFGDKLDFEEVKTFHFNIRIVKAILK